MRRVFVSASTRRIGWPDVNGSCELPLEWTNRGTFSIVKLIKFSCGLFERHCFVVYNLTIKYVVVPVADN